jgi:hypothetical protein
MTGMIASPIYWHNECSFLDKASPIHTKNLVRQYIGAVIKKDEPARCALPIVQKPPINFAVTSENENKSCTRNQHVRKDYKPRSPRS